MVPGAQVGTDLAKMAEGAGCIHCVTVWEANGLADECDRLLNDGQFGFLVAKIESGNFPPEWRQENHLSDTDGVEDKYRFMRYVERLEGTSIRNVRFW